MMRRRYLLVLVIVVACGGAELAEPTSTTASPTTTVATTTTTLPDTTTTLGPEQVLDQFTDNITNPDFQGEAEVTMEITLGGSTFQAAGRMLFHGDDYQSRIDIAGIQTTETIDVNGVEYERSDGGPWVSEERVTTPFEAPQVAEEGPPLDMIAMMKTIGELEHQSTVVEEGATVHRIGLPQGASVDPVAFGYAPEYPATIEVVFWAKADGNPHRFEFLIEDSSDPDAVIITDFILTFVEPKGPIEINAPEHSWLTYESDDFEYTIAHPRGWEVEEYRDDEFAAADLFFGLGGEELDVYRTELETAEQIALNSMVNEVRALVESDGLETIGTEEMEVAGLPGRLLTYGGDDGSGGDMMGIYVVTQVSPTAIFEFILITDGSDSEATRRLMLDFLATFEVMG